MTLVKDYLWFVFIIFSCLTFTTCRQEFAGTQISCDAFAYNTKAKVKFYGQIPSHGCSGINAFSMDWSNDFSCVVKIMTHVIDLSC